MGTKMKTMDGNTAAIIADEAYNIGVYAARSAAAGLLDKSVDPFLVVDALAIGTDNVVEGWNKSLNQDPPASVVEAAN